MCGNCINANQTLQANVVSILQHITFIYVILHWVKNVNHFPHQLACKITLTSFWICTLGLFFQCVSIVKEMEIDPLWKLLVSFPSNLCQEGTHGKIILTLNIYGKFFWCQKFKNLHGFKNVHYVTHPSSVNSKEFIQWHDIPKIYSKVYLKLYIKFLNCNFFPK